MLRLTHVIALVCLCGMFLLESIASGQDVPPILLIENDDNELIPQNGLVTFFNRNINGEVELPLLVPPFDQVDYVINDNLIFGDGGGLEIDADLVVQAGTTIWFNIGEPGEQLGDSWTNNILTFREDHTITCNGEEGDLNVITFEGNPLYEDVNFDDWFIGVGDIGYPPNTENLVFAGGFRLESQGNVFTFTNMNWLIGADVGIINGFGGDPSFSIQGREGAILLTETVGANVTLTDCAIWFSAFSGITSEVEQADIQLTDSDVMFSQRLVPDLGGNGNNSGLGYGIQICNGADINDVIITNNSHVSQNEGTGYQGEGNGETIELSQESQINENGGFGVFLDGGVGNHLFTIEDASTIDLNTGVGLYITTGGNNTVNIGENEGDCTIDNNGHAGIKIRNSSFNTINGFNNTHVNQNNGHGIWIQTVAGGNHLQNYCSNNTISFTDHCEVNLNFDLGEEADEIGHGIFLERTDFTTIESDYFSLINQNEGSGIYAIDSWFGEVDITANSEVNDNGICGIFFDSFIENEDLLPEKPDPWLPPIPIGTYCADCLVTIDNLSCVEHNLSPNEDHGGIVMLGFGHSVTVNNESRVNLNYANGIRMWCWDFTDLIIDANSEVHQNLLCGVTSVRPRICTVNTSRIGSNLVDGMFVKSPTLERNPEQQPEDRRDLEEDKVVYNVAISNNNVDPFIIEGNQGDGIRLVGTELPWLMADDGYNVDITFSTISNNGTILQEDGIQFQMMLGSEEREPAEFVIDNCDVLNNAMSGILLGPNFCDTEANITNTNISGNEQGVNIADSPIDAQAYLFECVIGPNDENGVEFSPSDGNHFEPTLVTVENCEFNQHADGAGIHFAPDSDINVTENRLNVHNCTFLQNQIGIHCENRMGVQLWIAPQDPSILPGNEINEFLGQIDCGILIETEFDINDRLPRVLIDRAKFNYWSDEPFFGQATDRHILLRGGLNGFDPDGVPDDNIGTIRKCFFSSCDIEAILLESVDEGMGARHPDVDILNNFFLSCADVAIHVDYFLQSGNTRIFNNTIDAVGPINVGTTQVGILLDDPEGQNLSALPSGNIHSNIFEDIPNLGNNAAILQAQAGVNPIYFNNCIPAGVPVGPNWQDNGTTVIDPSGRPQVIDLERLLFDSPCINAGFTDVVGPWANWRDSTFVENSTAAADGSQYMLSLPDIGCTGGGLYAGILDRHHFTILDDIEINDEHNLLPDEYEVENNLTVTANGFLTLDDLVGEVRFDIAQTNNCVFFMHEFNLFTERGEVAFNGLLTREASTDPRDDRRAIHFTNFPGNVNPWSGFFVDSPAEECELIGCEFFGASYNIDVWGDGVAPDHQLTIENCLLTGAEQCNLWVLDDVDVTCEETLISQAQSHGIQMLTNWEFSTFEFCLIEQNGSMWDDSGVWLFDSNPVFESCQVRHNFNHGFNLVQAGNPIIGNQFFWGDANDVYNNGRTLEQVGVFGLDGAEIYIQPDAAFSIARNNVWGAVGDDPMNPEFAERVGVLVRNDNALQTFDDFRTWWGTDWLDGDGAPVAALDLEDPNTWLTHFQNNVDFDLDEPEYLAGWGDANDPPDRTILDNADEYLAAKRLLEEENYREAANAYFEYIDNDPDDQYIMGAISEIQTCFRKGDGNLNELKNHYRRWARDWRDEYPQLSWLCERSAVRCSHFAGNNEHALREFNELRNQAPNPRDSLLIEMDIVLMESLIDGHRLNAVGTSKHKINDLRGELYRLNKQGYEQNNNMQIPSDFAILAAYPNPFNSCMTVNYSIPERNQVEISVFDVTGRRVTLLERSDKQPGQHTAVWDAKNQCSGVYFLRLNGCGRDLTQQVTLIR